jgi:hypothetical protein
MPLCRSFMDDSFGTAFERIYRRCFFLQDLRRRSIPPTVALRGARSFFVMSLVRESLLGFGEPKVRKTPSLSSLPRNDHNIPSVKWSHHATGTRVLAIHLLGFCGPSFSGCGRLFVRCGRLDNSPSHLWHYINKRVGVKLPQHSLLLQCFAAKNLTIAEACSSHSTEAPLSVLLHHKRKSFGKIKKLKKSTTLSKTVRNSSSNGKGMFHCQGYM